MTAEEKRIRMIYGDILMTQSQLDGLAKWMDDDIREAVHREFAPCEPAEFLVEYLIRQPEFESVVWEFGYYPWTGARKESAYKF